MDRSIAQDPAYYTYQGVWRNWDYSGSKSLTLTLCPTNAVLLTNALALFVAMAGGQLWTIIRFITHQVRAKSRSQSKSITYNQQQVVLRNATTDIASARLMLYLAWICRKHSGRTLTTCIVIAVLAIFNAAFFMVAGTFSNTLVNAGSTVLTISPHCGDWNQTYLALTGGSPNPTSDQDFRLSIEYIAKRERDVQLSLEYAQSCYMSPPDWYWASTCGTYPISRLNWTTSFNDSCPFESKVCSQDAATMILDTGIIDSHEDLGINAQKQDRLGYRRVTQCTVLNNEQYTTDWAFDGNSPEVASSPTAMKTAYANYGPSLDKDTKFTYSYSNFADFFTNFTGGTTIPYQVANQVAYGATTDPALQAVSSFEPIQELVRSDADVLLLFLSFIGVYTHPVDDPWFSAHNVLHRDTPAEIARTTYVRDKPISAIGCTEQHQFCSPTRGCTPLLGYMQVQEGIAADLRLTPKQNATLDRVLNAASTSLLRTIVEGMSITSTPLLAINATATESTTLSLPLSDTQWQHELQYWHSIAMAQLQRTVLEYSTGQIAAQTKYLIPTQTNAGAWLCQNQTILSSTYQSFSVLALALIVAFGGLVIVMSLTIETFSKNLQRRWGRGAYGRDMWKDHDMLGLQLWRLNFDAYTLWANGSPQQVSSPQSAGRIRFDRMTPYSFTGHNWGHNNWGPASSDRASSQALSSGDEARLQASIRAPSGRSPVRSAFTAEFAFDFGTTPSPSNPYIDANSSGNWDKKALPDVPVDQNWPRDEKNFIIDRGFENGMNSDSAAPAPPAASAEIEQRLQPPPSPEPVATTSGPGRWAYYSAHKRRYGPKLTVPSVSVASPSLNRLKGDFGNKYEGNWI